MCKYTNTTKLIHPIKKYPHIPNKIRNRFIKILLQKYLFYSKKIHAIKKNEKTTLIFANHSTKRVSS
jgi:hypothetical protein